MINRIIDISETSAFLHFQNKSLMIEVGHEKKASVPVSEIAVLLISNPAVSMTHAVHSEIAAAGGLVVVCDSSHMPAGMLLPLKNNSVQTEIFASQINASIPSKKRAWQQIIKQKILFQAELLKKINGTDFGLSEIASKVKSGDSENSEAWAAKRYWQALFPENNFKRDRDAEDQNMLLNYGYAVLRAITARAICSSGLHPSIGVHHHNKYDHFCFADDLMEPFRPLVDKVVFDIVSVRQQNDIVLDSKTKALLINALLGKVLLNGEARSLFDVLSRLTASIVAVLQELSDKLLFPEVLFYERKET